MQLLFQNLILVHDANRMKMTTKWLKIINESFSKIFKHIM